MSSSIVVPKRKQTIRPHIASSLSRADSSTNSPASDSYQSHVSNNSSYASSISPSSTASSPLVPSSKKLGKSRIVDKQTQGSGAAARRPSLMGSSLSKSEYTIVNLNSEGVPRLITCVKSSQGFDWNPELFLPSYMDVDSSELELRQDPVHEIVLTDEEANSMLP